MIGRKAPKERRKQLRAAAKAPRWLRDIASTESNPSEMRKHRDRKLGSFGAASSVRKIDPKDYEAAE